MTRNAASALRASSARCLRTFAGFANLTKPPASCTLRPGASA
ncbi:hypothetical protein [Caudoviricetes sp.]|nr:hypothetical protein [Caudoviricetes sp.]UOF81884.1 hypothetical protein [Caudoviricetes sp.]